jgi:hypothetical protein
MTQQSCDVGIGLLPQSRQGAKFLKSLTERSGGKPLTFYHQGRDAPWWEQSESGIEHDHDHGHDFSRTPDAGPIL